MVAGGAWIKVFGVCSQPVVSQGIPEKSQKIKPGPLIPSKTRKKTSVPKLTKTLKNESRKPSLGT